ncbi:MAG TPA: MerR family transcriptional regulator [Candidatus Aminicenantes bacterium]|nr:MerR family transcriptional regulator [Candidatus Aminicenantes bacterium]
MTANGIPEKLAFRRKEVTQLVKLDGRVLDFWEREFCAFAPTVNQAGEKFYSRQDLDTILQIKQWLIVERIDKARIREMLADKRSVTAEPPSAEEPPPPSSPSAAGEGEVLGRIRTGLAEILTMLDDREKM